MSYCIVTGALQHVRGVSNGAYTFEEAYKEIDEIYKRSGFEGIVEAADAGDE